MKKLLLLGLILGISLGGYAQQKAPYIKSQEMKNFSAKKPFRKAIDEPTNMLQQTANKYVKSALAASEEQIGTSRYDLQSNGSNQNRIYLHSDGTIGATWTYGVGETNFLDRGTGYNYFDGTAWGPEPTSRIEDVKVGWPSYLAAGDEGEMVVTHIGTTAGLKIAKRTTKGTGNWTYSNYQGPASAPELLWPRTVSGGDNNEYIHLFGLTAPVANTGTLYNGQDGAMMYSRSSNAGSTWDIQNVQFPNTDTNYSYGYSGDSYAWAQPKGNNLAFVYGDNWDDFFLMKSTDNGTTWTKTVIFQHPYPKFKETTTLVLDTPTVADGFMSVALDNSGMAHVTFGVMRVLNDDLTDGNTSYFPYTDGLGYWNESMGQLSTLDPDSLYEDNMLIGYTQDVNGNDTIFEFAGYGLYYSSVTSMPTMTIDQNNVIYVFFTSLMEGLDNGSQNYRHIYFRKSWDNGVTWSDFNDVTGSIIHNFDECVFPSLSPTTDEEFLHLIYQKDEEPGLAVRGDEDPYGDNYMIYMKVPKNPVSVNEVPSAITSVSQNFPNPFNGSSNVIVNLSKASQLGMEVTNFLGQKVYEIPSTPASSGYHTLTIDASNLLPGIYMYTVKAGSQTITKKMIVE
ncbi:MAG: T9SS type A sorting domain-containing protein [Bacteroidales bacterium]